MIPFEKTLTKKEETDCKAITHTDTTNQVLPTDQISQVYLITPLLCRSGGEDPGNENKG